MTNERLWQQLQQSADPLQFELFGDLRPGESYDLLGNRFDRDRFEQEGLGQLPRELRDARGVLEHDRMLSPADCHLREGLARVEEARKMISNLSPARRDVLEKLQLGLCQAAPGEEKSRLRAELRREFPAIYGKFDEAKEMLVKGVRADALAFKDRLKEHPYPQLSTIAGTRETEQIHERWRRQVHKAEIERPTALVTSWLRNDINSWDRPGPSRQAEIQTEQITRKLKAAGVSEADLASFRADASTFRNRRDVPGQEKLGTFEQVARLLDSGGDQRVTKEERAKIALQIVRHAANPTGIDQGFHNTCNVTTLQELMFSKHPSRAAELIVTPIVQNGTWTAPDGKTITLDSASFRPGLEEQATYPVDGQRSHASQIFQLVAVNDMTQRRSPPQYYQQIVPAGPGDTGERLHFADGTPVMRTGEQVKSPSVGGQEMSAFGTRQTGDKNFVFSFGDLPKDEVMLRAKSEADLVKQVRERLQVQRGSAIICVDANHPLFGGTGQPETAGRYHVVSITDLDEKNGRLRISNQWGAQNDRWVSVAELFQANRRFPQQNDSILSYFGF